MPSTVYKGDLAEVSFASETGIVINANTEAHITTATTAGNDFTTVTFTRQSSCELFDANSILLFPEGMLVGSQVKFVDTASSLDKQADKDGVFTIIANDTSGLKITPAMKSTNLSAVSVATLELHILPYKTPPINKAMTHAANSESVLTDQFLGITNALTLPETKVDLKRFHVVGLGRDTSIQVPGKFITEGGSFELAMHSARWLKYCLGGEVVKDGASSSVNTTLSVDAKVGATHITVASASSFAKDKYVEIDAKATDDDIPIVTTHEPDGGTWDGTFTDVVFDKASPTEIRKIVAVRGTKIYLDEPLSFNHTADSTSVQLRDYATSGTNPPAITSAGVISNSVTHLLFNHTSQPSFSMEVSQRRLNVDTDASATDNGVSDSKELTRVFRGCKVTDFTLSTDNDAALRLAVNFNSALCYTDTGRLFPSFTDSTCDTNHTSGLSDGATTSVKHITMDSTANLVVGMAVSGTGIPAGAFVAKINNATAFTLSANTTATNSNTTLTFTAVSKYASTRIFDDIATNDTGRLKAGIGVKTQKPFMFYNGTINLAGVQVAQVLNFTLTGQTGMQGFHVINGQNSQSSDTEQVPFGGSRNTSLMVEGQTSYEMTMEIAVDDPLFYHKMRSAEDFSTNADGTADNRIVIDFEKTTTTGSGHTERMMLIIDDYIIIEAPLQIPEDKGVVKSVLKIMPKTIKVIARDTILKY